MGDAPRPKVLFVLGGPGAGKGTQCEKVVEAFPDWGHVSAGDCLRAERKNPESKDGEIINACISEGKIVPVSITVKLLQKAMAAAMKDGKRYFLIDGYPRNMDNVTGWEENVGDAAEVLGVLFYTANEAEMERRLLGRGETSGRDDDNLEVIRKRFRTYVEETMPIVEKYRAEGKVFEIDGMPAMEEVWAQTQSTVQRLVASAARPKVLFVLGGPGAGKGTQCAKVVENFPKWGHISAGDCLRAERQNPDSKDGELINNYIKEGQIVPVAITVKLLQKAMAAQMNMGKTCFLVDGYPRNMDNVTGWEENVGDRAEILGVLFYTAQEDELERRLLGRGETSGRVDDNIEAIRKRFRTYVGETMPIVERYRAEGKVFEINGMPPVEEVWTKTEQVIRAAEGSSRPRKFSCSIL